MVLAKLCIAIAVAASLTACASGTTGGGAAQSRKIDFQRLSSPDLDCGSIKPYEWAWVTPRSGCVEYERR
jgi:hypothetical protein